MTMKRVLLVVIATLAIGTGAGFAATLGIGSDHLWAGSQTLTKGTCTVTGAAADTYVNESSKSSSYGSTTTLDVNPDNNAHRWAFLRFDLSSCGLPTTAGADSARLSLYVTNAPILSETLTLARVNSSWSTSLTWYGAQSLSYGDTTDTSSSGRSTGTWIDFTVTGDVDDFIKGGTNNGWRIVESGGGWGTNYDLTQFASTNASSNKPKLVIDYER
jgi:hypothetical protein